MSDTKDGKKKTKLEIKESIDWGDNFSLIMFPDPRACPECKSVAIKSLVYGLPDGPLSSEEKEDHKLGGCMVRAELWHCEACGFEWPQHSGVIVNPSEPT